jgi:2-dehydro-3-deoxygalactonokinase
MLNGAAMPSALPLVAIDWGTTNRRLFLIDAEGNCLHEEEDHGGVASLGRAALAGSIAQLRDRFPGHHMLLAGMIGSSIGWADAPYIACPADLERLVTGVVMTEDPLISIIPGVRSAPDETADVMRGEEVQLIGAVAAGLIPANGIVCHPGTHTKWVHMKNGAIHAFRTVMTGELFALLRGHSILSDALDAPVAIGPAFEAGIRDGLASPCLGAGLFEIRARLLLGQLSQADAASWASGLLIGSDIAFGLKLFAANGPIAVLGDPQLTNFYATGLRLNRKLHVQISGSEAFISGMNEIRARLPWPV